MKGGKISADYSSFILEKAGDVSLNADYTKSQFESIDKLIYNCDYGSITIKDAGKIDGSSDYMGVRLGKVRGSVNLNLDYGSVKIEEITPQAGDISIATDYASVKIGYQKSCAFRFAIKLSYAGLKGEEDLEVTRKQEESFSEFYEGYYGSASAKNTLNITSDYGGVSLTKIN